MRLFFTILITSLVAFTGCTTDPPTDAALRETFAANQATFERLHQMMQTDKSVVRIGNDVVGNIWFDSSDSSLADALLSAGLPRERYDDYMELLRQVGAYRVSVNLYDKSSSKIGMYRAGNVAESHSVDIVFAAQPPNTIVADTVSATVHDNTSAYLELTDSWYIYREHD